MSIDFDNLKNATREELLAYIEQQKLVNKKTNKITKLLNDLKNVFDKQFPNNTDPLLWLHFLLSVLYNNLVLPTTELLDELDYVPEEEDVKKVFITENKALSKTDEFKLRKSKKNVVTVEPVVEDKEVSTPL